MKNRRNFYRILHVQPDAPKEIIKASYRALMTKLDKHPDRGGDHETAALINEAYRVLSDEAKRRRYDQSLLKTYAETVVGGKGQHKRPDPRNHQRNRRGADMGKSYEPAIQYYCAFCMTPHAYGENAPPEVDCIECHSPLIHAPKMTPVQSGRRVMYRVSANEPLGFFAHWPQDRPTPGSLTDLSLNGIQFNCEQPIEPYTNIKVQSALLDAVVRIVYCRAPEDVSKRYTVGAKFLTLRLHKNRGAFVSVET